MALPEPGFRSLVLLGVASPALSQLTSVFSSVKRGQPPTVEGGDVLHKTPSPARSLDLGSLNRQWSWGATPSPCCSPQIDPLPQLEWHPVLPCQLWT